MMEITCPHCNFSKTIDPSRLPERPVKVTCPRCREPFSFDKTTLTEAVGAQPITEPLEADAPASPAQVICPVCGLLQPVSEACQGCGLVYAKWQAGRQARCQQDLQAGTVDARNGADAPPAAARQDALNRPKAGFWLRLVAYGIDGAIVIAIQFLLGLLLNYLLGLSGALAGEGSMGLVVVSGLLSATISFSYGLFFIGYCGQTPAKMMVRIKVIRTDGSAMTYGRAFLREVLGKFFSAILLGIGYLMVAFDSQKQGLHDKIADTYVIKL